MGLTMTKTNLIDFLKKYNACKEGIAWAEAQEFGPDALTKAPDEYLTWLIGIVGGAALAEYQRITGPAWAEYKRVKDAARAEYERVEVQAARQALTWERLCEAVDGSVHD